MEAAFPGKATTASYATALAIAKLAADAMFCGFRLAPKANKPGEMDKVPQSIKASGVSAGTPLSDLLNAVAVMVGKAPPGDYWGVVMHRPIEQRGLVLVGIDLDMKRSGGPADIRIKRLIEIAKAAGHLYERSHSLKGAHIWVMAPADATMPPKIDLGNGQEIEIFGMPRSRRTSVMLTGTEISGNLIGVRSLRELLASAGIETPVESHEVEVERPMTAHEKVADNQVEEMLRHIVNADLGYDEWLRICMAAKSSGGSFETVSAWSATSPKHNERDFFYKWRSFTDKPGGVTLGTLKMTARESGWEPPDGFGAFEAQVTTDARASKSQATADALRQARRQEQKDANADIQRLSIDPLPTVMSQDDMLRKLVFVQDGSQVCALDNPRLSLPLSDARNTFAASVTASADGKKMRPAINGWLADPSRLTVARRTFMPGEDVFCMGPEGHPSINTWRDFKRAPVANSALAVGVFLEHVTYLIADETERAVFLDWLAHIEQQPGVLPHFGWLMIARHTGTGRNWLASVLARVWRGHVAPNVDLASLLESQFNGQLSEAMLAMVDEIQEGGEAGYRHINRLKSLLNAEVRAINPKYGRTVLEKNVCRWLVFSNHENAIPMADNDRRWRVVVHNEPPRPAADYERLYQALADPAFIAAIAHWLRVRDISAFKPGERPPMSAAKSVAVDASKSGVRRAADQLIEDWGSDLITAGEALRYLEEQCGKLVGNAARHALVDAGARSFRAPDGRERKVKSGSKTYRVWSLRNHDKWANSAAFEAKDEVQRGSKDSFY